MSQAARRVTKYIGDPARSETNYSSQRLVTANRQKIGTDFIAEFPGLANSEDHLEKENPAATAIANGAYDCGSYRTHHTPKRPVSAMSKWGKLPHKRVARALGYALTSGTYEAWMALRSSILLRLSEKERAALAFAALSSLSEDEGYKVASTALFGTINGETFA